MRPRGLLKDIGAFQMGVLETPGLCRDYEKRQA